MFVMTQYCDVQNHLEAVSNYQWSEASTKHCIPGKRVYVCVSSVADCGVTGRRPQSPDSGNDDKDLPVF